MHPQGKETKENPALSIYYSKGVGTFQESEDVTMQKIDNITMTDNEFIEAFRRAMPEAKAEAIRLLAHGKENMPWVRKLIDKYDGKRG